MSDYKQTYKFWLEHASDAAVHSGLRAMARDEAKIEDAFYKDLEFGTAGLRGIMEAGTNRLNVYTLFRATMGVARYMQSHGMTSCAITYDSRNNSQLFSETAAATLAYCGIKVYITRECMPTPYLSFMVRNYKTDMGINVTASHNAAQYNGYKVYDSEGCQLTDDAANEVTEFISGVDPFEIPIPVFSDYVGGLITYADEDMCIKYKQCVIAQGLNDASGISIVYSPLNGAGYKVVPEVLRCVGLEKLDMVSEQSVPNGDFPTCPYPNPEKAEALSLALKLAAKKGCDAVLANDPDCDRLGVAVRHNGEYAILSGNDVGLLLCDYVLSYKAQQGTLCKNPVIVKTIVSTVMVEALAKKYNAEVRNVLTGFKYIGATIKELEDEGEEHRFLFGFEESCGYLKGSYVRDKDGVVAAMLACQCIAYWRKHGKTLVDRLDELKAELGNSVQKTFSYTFEGAEGAQKIKDLFVSIRNHPLQKLGNSKVVASTDFLTQTQLKLPKSNVIRYNSQDGSQVILRPSGTEPLVKCYVTAQGDDETIAQRFDEIKNQLDAIMK
ncbi:MAG: phospho-sugar mutase [Corallococcus sp.]|nr:phospho-sugar mutase [Corallococcus sp.]MCM1359012.1 phospho-sugar mutase [Corallococcus sp.]MCM1395001.1 phospho-sugar mutase [Corallococcus sp.]